MTAKDPARMPRRRGFLVLTTMSSVVAMTYPNGHLRHEVDPFSGAVSYYVFHGDGREEYHTSVFVLAAGTLVGLRSAGLRLGVPATAFFGIWCVSRTLCAIFPTDDSTSTTSTSGLVHQVAGASLFMSLPSPGWRSRADSWPPVAGYAWPASCAACRWRRWAWPGAYLATRLPDVFPGLTIPGILDGRGISGLAQRALFGIGMLMSMALAVHLLRVTVSTARERREPARAEVTG